MEVEDDDEAADKPIYNPLNLPLGWDGKPIPYWLYKLHGLNIEYKCEICGNYSYWGPRAFERHFQEWRHAHGMRCLGVPARPKLPLLAAAHAATHRSSSPPGGAGLPSWAREERPRRVAA